MSFRNSGNEQQRESSNQENEKEADESDKRHLETIQKQNKERREKLRQFADDYKNGLQEMQDTKQVAMNTALGNFFKPTNSDKLDAVQVDLDLLQERKISDASANNSFPSCLEYKSCHTPSSSTESKMLLQQMGKEVVESYEDLHQTNAVLEEVLQREQKKLGSKRQFISEQKDLEKALHDEIRSVKTRIESSKDDRETQASSTNKLTTNLQSENQWIREQLVYVANKLKGEVGAESSSMKTNRKRQGDQLKNVNSKKQKRTDDSSLLSSSQRGRSLDEIVLLLMKQFLDDPIDPYLFISHADGQKDDNDNEEKARRILLQCAAIETHPENERLFRLTDYRN